MIFTKLSLLAVTLVLLTACSPIDSEPVVEAPVVEVPVDQPVMCTLEYAPVCGKIEVQCITTPCDPVQETFGNRCQAEARGAFDIVEGECV